MKKLLLGLLVLGSISSFAVTDAQIVGAVFTNSNFLSVMGRDKLNDIKIAKRNQNVYQVVVNSNAPLVDGCSYVAFVSVAKERYAINPSTTGIRTVLRVSNVKDSCGWR